ncbi:MAG: hypothetical protein H7228_16130 [Polaromonas sp.]|nr:hypothetical protein [Polaromonas sp.]
MMTFAKSSPFSPNRSHETPDFVSSDAAALASHMNHCASTRSRFFGLHAALEYMHSLVFSRMVTAGVLAVILLGVVGIV